MMEGAPAARNHLPLLDGLRGTAAIAVLTMHFQEISINLSSPDSPWLNHAYLAVDFFFCLSGYVIGHAYDHRRERLGVRGFLAARLIRLHPLVIVGALLGLASLLLEPLATGPIAAPLFEKTIAPDWKIAAALAGGLLLVPSWTLPNRFGCYFPLNAPAWSLMWEYLASLTYALWWWRVGTRTIGVVMLLGAAGVVWSAWTSQHLAFGFGWGQMAHALARTTFSFTAGLLIFRLGAKLRTPLGFFSLSAIMIALFLVPIQPGTPWGGAFDALVVLLVFPLTITIAAGATTAGRTAKLCLLLGRLSYPVYILHYAFVTLFMRYFWTVGISPSALPLVIAATVLLVIGFAWIVLVIYDEPVRRWLTARNRFRGPRPPVPVPAEATA